MRATPFAALLCLLAACGPRPAALPEPTRPTTADTALSDRRVAYVMDVTLDPDARTVAGTARITWRNADRVPVDTLQFHFYLNAFRDSLSTFMRESGGAHRGFTLDEGGWGGLDIASMRFEGRDLAPDLRFIQTTSDNPDDRTVAELVLPRAIAPGDSATLDVAFTARLPRIFARTGWATAATGEPFFMVAQWFPKLGVREIPGQRYVPADAPRGRWSTHQFHQNTEFYADFGLYRVTMRVPEGYAVGATGIRTHADTTGGIVALTYAADDVHDFAWTASPAFRVYEDQWRHVRLRLLVQPEHGGQAQRHFDAARTALESYARLVGPYPYTTLTLVDGIGGSNGMEYPTLITCGTVYALPRWLRALEMVTIHEFGHQYFYGMLASNEAEEAWLDEGFNSYMEARVMDGAYGRGSIADLPGLKISDTAMQRMGYVASSPETGVIAAPAYRQEGYSKLAYTKPATILLSLQRHLGDDVMDRIMQQYYQQWRFRHPTTRDFRAVAERVSGQDLSWFFDAYVYGTDVVSYGVESLTVEQVDAGYAATAIVGRQADGVFPQTLVFVTEGGRGYAVPLDGEARRDTVRRTYPDPVAAARLESLPLDLDPLDDARSAAPDNAFAHQMQVKYLAWAQQLIALAGGF